MIPFKPPPPSGWTAPGRISAHPSSWTEAPGPASCPQGVLTLSSSSTTGNDTDCVEAEQLRGRGIEAGYTELGTFGQVSDWAIYLSIHPSMCPHPSTHRLTHPSTHPPVESPTHPSTHLSFHICCKEAYNYSTFNNPLGWNLFPIFSAFVKYGLNEAFKMHDLTSGSITSAVQIISHFISFKIFDITNLLQVIFPMHSL